MKYKKCNKCGNWKEKTEFYKHSANSDWLLGMCKPCKVAKSLANQEAKKEYQKQYQKDYRAL